MAPRGLMPVRNLPNTAKVCVAVQGDLRHGARASVKSRKTAILEIEAAAADRQWSRNLPTRSSTSMAAHRNPADLLPLAGSGYAGVLQKIKLTHLYIFLRRWPTII